MRFLRSLVLISVLVTIPAVSAHGAEEHEEAEEVTLHSFTIQTVPAVEGMVVQIGEMEYRSGPGGLIRASLPEGIYEVRPAELVQIDDNTRFLFRRWNDTYDRTRQLELRRDRDLQIGVIIQYNTRLEYVNGLSQSFSSNLIQSVVMINSNGDGTTVSNEPAEDDGGMEIGSIDNVWMTANRLRRTGAGLLSKETVYTVRQVFVRGENVVQSGKAEYEPGPSGTWELQLRLFSLFVDVRSFGFNRPVAGDIGLRKTGLPEPFQMAVTEAGIAEFVNVPVGEFELTVEEGGWAPVSPVIFTGPKTEILTVLTPWVRSLGVFMLLLLVLSFLVFLLYKRWRLRILMAWVGLAILAMNAPAIGALSGRHLSLEVTPVFTESGEFVGFDAVVQNAGSFPISQVYCRPDFELRVLESGGVWSASYESPDFHDVEFGECREHRVRPGQANYRLAPAPGQEWVTQSPEPLPPGEYVAYVRLFDIPAPAISLNLDNTVSPDTSYDYEVRARDAASNVSAPSNPLNVVTPIGPPMMTFLATDDATIRESKPTRNYGARTSLEVDADSRKDTLIRFDVSGVGSSSVLSATLRLFNIDRSSFGGDFWIVTDPGWSQDTVTWANAPAGDGGFLGSLGSVSAGTWYEIDVTALVTGDGAVSIRITSDNRNGADYASTENSNGNAPQLIVTTAP